MRLFIALLIVACLSTAASAQVCVNGVCYRQVIASDSATSLYDVPVEVSRSTPMPIRRVLGPTLAPAMTVTRVAVSQRQTHSVLDRPVGVVRRIAALPRVLVRRLKYGCH